MIGSSAEIATEVARILVVDDSLDNCFLLQTALEIEGYSVELAHSGQAALESIASHPPNLVLLDVMMPGMDGFEVTRRLRQNPSLPCIAIILITGYGEPTPADEFDVKADGFVCKPFNLDYLLHQIRTILEPRSLTDLP